MATPKNRTGKFTERLHATTCLIKRNLKQWREALGAVGASDSLALYRVTHRVVQYLPPDEFKTKVLFWPGRAKAELVLKSMQPDVSPCIVR